MFFLFVERKKECEFWYGREDSEVGRRDGPSTDRGGGGRGDEGNSSTPQIGKPHSLGDAPVSYTPLTLPTTLRV